MIIECNPLFRSNASHSALQEGKRDLAGHWPLKSPFCALHLQAFRLDPNRSTQITHSNKQEAAGNFPAARLWINAVSSVARCPRYFFRSMIHQTEYQTQDSIAHHRVIKMMKISKTCWKSAIFYNFLMWPAAALFSYIYSISFTNS